MKKEKPKCRWCKKGGNLKYYIIADDMENPKPYHKTCIEKMKMEALTALWKISNATAHKRIGNSSVRNETPATTYGRKSN